ncbi:MAG: flavodoxin family protein [Bacillota bacterium]
MVEDAKIRILGISGSPRKGATSMAMQLCLNAAAEVEGVETILVDLAGKQINCCCNCNLCAYLQTPHCPAFQDDFQDEHLDLYCKADGIILASPVYLMNPTGLIANFMSRMRAINRLSRRGAFSMRVGGSIAVGGMRNGGQDMVLASLNAMLQTSQNLIVGGGVHFYNGAAVWSNNEKKFTDEKGSLELAILGRRVAYSAKAIKAGLLQFKNELSACNYSGFHSNDQLDEAFKEIQLNA